MAPDTETSGEAARDVPGTLRDHTTLRRSTEHSQADTPSRRHRLALLGSLPDPTARLGSRLGGRASSNQILEVQKSKISNSLRFIHDSRMMFLNTPSPEIMSRAAVRDLYRQEYFR